MRAMVYLCCSCLQRREGEENLVAHWTKERIDKSELISLGLGKDWKIAEIVSFEPDSDRQIEAIDLVYLYRGEEPPRLETWEFHSFLKNYPEQTLEINVSSHGSNFLGVGAIMYGDLPRQGRLFSLYGQSAKGEAMQALTAWEINRVSTFKPQGEPIGFSQAFLCHHSFNSHQGGIDGLLAA